MQHLNDELLFSSSDLGNFLACEHLTQSSGPGAPERPAAELRERLRGAPERKGQERNEEAFLESLRGRPPRGGGAAGRGAGLRGRNPPDGGGDAGRGAGYVYQAVFFSSGWRGIADFLERVDRPSALGDFSYQVLDTKLARHPPAGACAAALLLQPGGHAVELCARSRLCRPRNS